MTRYFVDVHLSAVSVKRVRVKTERRKEKEMEKEKKCEEGCEVLQ